ncbi:MAG: hypothetical protein ACOVSW_18020 [Candidatus Kapaibacteriota bacterium]|jgi:hypothetical protein
MNQPSSSNTARVPHRYFLPLFIRTLLDKIILYTLSKLFSWLIALFLSFPSRQRMSHNNGIAAEGSLRIVDNPEFPPNDFFAPGTVFPLRIRHASASFLDDATSNIRSISIKLSHERFKSPFDIELNTGRYSLFWSVRSFIHFANRRKEAWGVEYVRYVRQYPPGLAGAIDGLRRNPTSYRFMHYFSQTAYKYIDSTGIAHYAKYRVLPFGTDEDSGVDPEPCAWDITSERVLKNETRGRNYLKYEYEDALAKAPAKYRLQIQTRRMCDDDTPDVCNNMILWDETAYPWKDLAVLEVHKILDWEESTLTTFSVNNMPKTLGILPATSIYDGNSLNYMRAHSEIARKARLFSYKVFGMPPQIPDNDNRNVSNWGE